MKGEVVFYRLFDLGASVDLDEIQGTVDMPFLAGRMLSERATPKYARFAAPLLVYVDQRTLETNVGSLVASIAVKLYGVGALAVVVRAPFETSVLRDLRPFAGLRIRAADKEETLDAYCGRLVARIIEDLVPFLHDSYEVNVDPEPYTVYCVSVTETPVRVFTTAWRREVTALLAHDPRPDAISDVEVEDTSRNWFSYYQDDLVVLDWDAALVIEPSASYEDTLTVFELANLQLLELRTYDAFLDKVVDKAYDDLEDLFARSSLLRSGHETVKELAEVRMDLAEASFQVDNISKLWGDWFLGKVYRACAKKFELDSGRMNRAGEIEVQRDADGPASGHVERCRRLQLATRDDERDRGAVVQDSIHRIHDQAELRVPAGGGAVQCEEAREIREGDEIDV